MLEEIRTIAIGVAVAVLPLAALFVFFQVALLRLPRDQAKEIIWGTALAAGGLFLFLLGVSIGFLPFGRAIGQALGVLPTVWLVLLGGVLGFLTTWGEPAVRILATQVEEASAGSLRASLVVFTICAGVAVWVGLGMLRIAFGIPLLYLVIPGYTLAIALLFASEKPFAAIAVDAGGVATGPLANSFLLAFALGCSAGAGRDNALVDGLGLVALIGLAPIVSVMMLGMLVRWKQRRRVG